MFDSKEPDIINKVFNPLKITKSSIVEFSIGPLKDTGIYKFKKIIEMSVGNKSYSRYLVYSMSENTEYIFEVFPGATGQVEAYLYNIVDTIPFDEEFLNVAGQLYLTTPNGDEYQRCTMPENEGRIDGVSGRIKVYDIQSDQVERIVGLKVWDYERDVNGITEYLNIEMMEDSGMFRIFVGEMIEDVFYKVYQGTK
ncbi:MAG: hypothetical protein N3B21_03365 [Clostridia bacterium]|nr:hypothetical protein [Clostridia bacterium]